jgi:hypothetical protein
VIVAEAERRFQAEELCQFVAGGHGLEPGATGFQTGAALPQEALRFVPCSCFVPLFGLRFDVLPTALRTRLGVRCFKDDSFIFSEVWIRARSLSVGS